MSRFWVGPFLFIFWATGVGAQQHSYPWLGEAPGTRTIRSVIAVPPGYQRTRVAAKSYAGWLRHLPLKPAGTSVKLHSGELKSNQSVHHAVVNLDTGKRNLQQCADAAIRLHSEFLWAHQRDSDIGFHLTNGTWVPWRRWKRGKRASAKRFHSPGNDGSPRGRLRPLFRKYMRHIMVYAGTASLDRWLPKRAVNTLAIGDLLIQGGFPGHAIVVVDMAQNTRGQRLVLLGQSYMPAQDFHVLKNTARPRLSPWFRLSDLQTTAGLRTPEWSPFHASDLRAMAPSKQARRRR